MKKVVFTLAAIVITSALATSAYAEIKYVKGYTRSNGTYVNGHYRDTSGDGNMFNNANYLGYNDND